MKEFTFIHASDLHLGAPVFNEASGLSRAGGVSFVALSRLVELCLKKQAAFLLLAGDLYNLEQPSLSARLALRDAFAELEKGGVEVFWVHGNHDPLEKDDYNISWPSNVHRFGDIPSCYTATFGEDKSPLAKVYGISFNRPHEERNLARMFLNMPEENSVNGVRKDLYTESIYKIGVMHCAVSAFASGKNLAHAPYAPCTRSDLIEAGMDYWALGHVHTNDVIAEDPQIRYSGSLQGQHINEDGPHGCYIINVNERGQGIVSFAPLAPLRWEKVEFDLAGNKYTSADSFAETGADSGDFTLDGLETEVLHELEKLAVQIYAEQEEYPCEWLACRIVLTGRSKLDGILRREGAVSDIAERLTRNFTPPPCSTMRLRIKDIILQSSPDVNLESMHARDDILGECFKIAAELLRILEETIEDETTDPTLKLEELPDIMSSALTPLYANQKLKTHKWLEMFSADELRFLLHEASLNCLRLLPED